MRCTLAIVACITLTACAGYCVSDVNTGRDGYVVYEPEPYILRQPDVDAQGKLTGWKFETVYLPNRNRGYRVKTWSGFGKADFKFDFENGWMLKGIQDKSDNTAVLAALKDLIPNPADMFGGATPEPAKPIDPEWWNLVMYRFEYDTCGRIAGISEVKIRDLDFDKIVKPEIQACP